MLYQILAIAKGLVESSIKSPESSTISLQSSIRFFKSLNQILEILHQILENSHQIRGILYQIINILQQILRRFSYMLCLMIIVKIIFHFHCTFFSRYRFFSLLRFLVCFLSSNIIESVNDYLKSR